MKKQNDIERNYGYVKLQLSQDKDFVKRMVTRLNSPEEQRKIRIQKAVEQLQEDLKELRKKFNIKPRK